MQIIPGQIRSPQTCWKNDKVIPPMKEILLMKFSLCLKTNKAEFSNLFSDLFETWFIECE